MRRIAERYKQEPLLYLVTLLFVVGLAMILVGIIYTTVSAASLPSFVPGHTAGLHRTRAHRGDAGIVVGVMILILATIIATDVGKARS